MSQSNAKTDCTTLVVVNKTLTASAHVVLQQTVNYEGPYLFLLANATVAAGTWFNVSGDGQAAVLFGSGTIQAPQAFLGSGEIAPGAVFGTEGLQFMCVNAIVCLTPFARPACDICLAGLLSLLFGPHNHSTDSFGDLFFDVQTLYLSAISNFFIGSNMTLRNVTGKSFLVQKRAQKKKNN
jgi:hypothetical protein